MSDLLREMMDRVGMEFLSEIKNDDNSRKSENIDICEKKIFPDFDHVTVI